MKSKYYKMLSKEEMMEIIKGEKKTKDEARRRVIAKLKTQIKADEAERNECDINSPSGRFRREVLTKLIRKNERILTIVKGEMG